jgi:endonuclease-3 related protein
MTSEMAPNATPRRPTGTRKKKAPPAPALRHLYGRLRRRFGPAGWWPGETPFEICLGAVLVQNTAWTNAARAIAVLRERGLLSFEALRGLRVGQLAPLIRSSGYFRIKARRVRALLDFLGARYGGRVEAMQDEDPWRLRAALLEVPGVGPETADSIVLYAAGLPVFVIDAYTRRVFARLGLIRGDEPYPALQAFFMRRLPRQVALYNDFHAQIVTLGKDFCRARPRCAECPLDDVCPRRGVGRMVD